MKILKKVKFSKNQNRMKAVGNVEDALNYFKTKKNKNLYFLTKKSYSLMYGWTQERRELDYLRFAGASDETAKEVKDRKSTRLNSSHT